MAMAKRYQFLEPIFGFVQDDDNTSVKNIFDEYDPTNLGFLTNKDESLLFIDDTSMQGWSLLSVALGLKAHRIVNYLLKS